MPPFIREDKIDHRIQEKIDRVLDGIHDPQTGLTLSQMGLVEKIRYVEEQRKLIVMFNRLGPGKACCSVLNMTLLADFEDLIKKGFQTEFPQFSIRLTTI